MYHRIANGFDLPEGNNDGRLAIYAWEHLFCLMPQRSLHVGSPIFSELLPSQAWGWLRRWAHLPARSLRASPAASRQASVLSACPGRLQRGKVRFFDTQT